MQTPSELKNHSRILSTGILKGFFMCIKMRLYQERHSKHGNYFKAIETNQMRDNGTGLERLIVVKVVRGDKILDIDSI